MVPRLSAVRPLFSARALARLAAVAVVAAGLGGCTTVSGWFGGNKTVVQNDEPADQLYNEALYHLQQKEYRDAIDKFNEVDNQHPYTEQAAKAVLMITYIHYSRGDYSDAIESGKRYLTIHPASPDAAYVEFMVAMSYYNQIPDVTRDQADTQKALAALQDVVNKYPNTDYADAANRRIQVARDQLAGHELAVGRYYLEKRDYIGAINRFRTVITQYQTTREVEEALARVAEAYMAMGIVEEAQTAAAILGHNYPSSQWYKDTYALVTSHGLKPEEHPESWMSKAFKAVGMG
ncbi:MAG TPA: outer membrane protein assembly factor BamD [Hyphomicrobiales bacterium]|nr:outer membrane protein assembly factor BamD [Hyphomicrobiales bacterium]